MHWARQTRHGGEMPHNARRRLQFRYWLVTMRVALSVSQFFTPPAPRAVAMKHGSSDRRLIGRRRRRRRQKAQELISARANVDFVASAGLCFRDTLDIRTAWHDVCV